jgi:hypothetical protein
MTDANMMDIPSLVPVAEAKMKTTNPSRSTSSACQADDVDLHRLEHHQSKGHKGRVLRERSLSFQEGPGAFGVH